MLLNHKINCSSYGELKPNSIYNDLNLNHSDIFIYQIYLPDYFDIVDALISLLNFEEITRVNRYYHETDKNRFIICRSILKYLLSKHTRLDIQDIEIDYQANKKPHLSSHPSTFFNISHSENYAFIAIANRPIGIDIEYINKNFNFTPLLQDIFSDIEISFIKNSQDKRQSFYSLWTRKEAFVKALGKGIDDDFLKIPSLDGLHHLNTSDMARNKNWNIHGFEITDHYIGALAYEETPSLATSFSVISLSNELSDLIELLRM
ncbi:4'-phosphopantetheinyl transferase family protein [Litoribaculum gwangyangense]|uniref:4'-phosphopantetheinyl transferase superfamily protein n=1 Tax=Litoribaculum gwangyangense TaxID=1130722 RepID=A0ABP9D108_9FLAO